MEENKKIAEIDVSISSESSSNAAPKAEPKEEEEHKSLKEYIIEHKVPFIIFNSIFVVCLLVVVICLCIALSNGNTSSSPSWTEISETTSNIMHK